MRICFAVLYYSPRLVSGDPAEYLSRVPLLREVPQRLAARGHRVDLVHAYPFDLDHDDGGVAYRFVAAPRAVRLAARLGERLLGRERAELEPARRAVRRVVDLEPDVVHFHGVTLHLNLGLLRRSLAPHVPLVLHHHGGGPARRGLARRIQRRNFARASLLLVSSRAHAEPFIASGVLGPERVAELMESSSTMRCRPRAAARRETGMEGDPVFLCAARLHPVKDPITLLSGFERVAAALPGARLYLYYLSAELLEEMRAWVAARADLAGRVEFRGRVPAPRMEAVMNSADFLLQASRREWSGVAVLDAMACGTIPIVTDIPAFRAIVGGDGHDLLFPVGDAEAMARRVLAIPRPEIARRSAAVRRRFDEHLSFASLARRLEELYGELKL